MHDTPIDAFSPATVMLEGLNKRQVSAVELLDLHLHRIERYNSAVNAIVTFDIENARQVAIAADQARVHGEHRALLGLPITIKDTIDVRGLPGTAGVELYKDRRPEYDAPLVARVRAAGAVIMGKTNVPPFAGDWQSDNSVFGRTNNPWDLSRSPGGSTGGGAAALAAGLSPLEFGSDIGGSIRIPAAFCGVFGHKPSETAVPRSGQFPGTPLPNAATVMSALGPLARDAHDLELAFDVIAGPAIGEQDHKRRHQAEAMRLSGDRYLKASADGIMAGASDYIIWHGQRETYRAKWRAFFQEWDVLLTPTNIVPAFPHTDAPFQQRTLTINGVTVPYSRQSAYAGIATLAGQPATAFPVGITSNGLPIGLQVIGPYLEDRTPIRFASLVTRELGGFHRPPGYDEHF